VAKRLAAEKGGGETLTVYAGFDPTADSLHLGHLVPIMTLAHLQRAGHRILALVGGATGMIGDPSGKSEERNLLTPEQVAHNVEGQGKQLARFLDFDGENPAKIVNNADWIGGMSFLEWLRDVGKHFTVNYMLAKDSVKSRIGSEAGISFTEFSYMTMQAYDFLHLYDTEGCTLQCGGNDQWGNITAGIDLVRKLRAAQVFGVTCPLVTTSSGEKFGKTAGNAVWLDAGRTSPYLFYQYWINVDDRDVVRYLNYFTFLGADRIAALEEQSRTNPGAREAQKALAWEVTKLVHGEDLAGRAKRASEVMFGGEVTGLSDEEVMEAFAEVPSVTMEVGRLEAGIPLVDLLAASALVTSKGEARRLVKAGGASVNNRRETNIGRILKRDDLASEHVMVLRSGKKNYRLVRFE
jgi:tyrosyl-tRNA synthetase